MNTNVWEVLSSQEDMSVNHVLRLSDKEVIEARFVQRHEDYIVCYLSSHTGCSYSCRFCHLTATSQTVMQPLKTWEYLIQADKVLKTYSDRLMKGQRPAKTVHFNFMARGEALGNPFFLERPTELFRLLAVKADVLSLYSKFLVSTIMPYDFDGDLSEIFAHPDSVPYYSLYSINPQFRKRWLPKAMDPVIALRKLAEFQQESGREVVLHWAFIDGQNDQEEEVTKLLDLVEFTGLKARFNLVRYNPHNQRHGQESPEPVLQARFEQIQSRLLIPGSRIVPRVGRDVFASCGMFVEG